MLTSHLMPLRNLSVLTRPFFEDASFDRPQEALFIEPAEGLDQFESQLVRERGFKPRVSAYNNTTDRILDGASLNFTQRLARST